MDSRRSLDKLSSLSDSLLVLIISILPFKDVLKMTSLSRRWRNLCYKTTNISFKEHEFVKCSTSNDEETKRVSFFRYMVDWMFKFSGETIKSFELFISKPVGFETQIKSLVELVVSKKVNNLVLDFSDPAWIINNDQALAEESAIQLPKCVYDSTTLESLKLFAYGFEPSRLMNMSSLKTLCFGWIQLGKIMSLISNSALISSLSITNCWNVNLVIYNNQWLRELIFENCEFFEEYSTLTLPNIQNFKYSGEFHYFKFMEVNKHMKEAYLDFRVETDYTDETGSLLCGLIYDLLSAKKLTVCHYLLLMIQNSDDPIRLQAEMETRDLVMKTNLQPNEFVGIRLMINSCPNLEILTFVMVPPGPVFATASVKDPDKYWRLKINHECLKKTLKVVEVRNFRGGLREAQVLQYLIRYGRVVERVDLYMSTELDDDQKRLAHASSNIIRTTFVRASNRVSINLHTD